MRAALALVVVTGGCAGGDDGGCPERWEVRHDETLITSAAVSEGSLQLSAQTRGTGTSLLLVKPGLSGDFEIEVDYADPQLVGWLGYFWAYVRDPLGGQLLFAAVTADRDLFPVLQVGTMTENLDALTLAPTGSLTGRLYLRRQGDLVELEASGGSDAAMATTTFANDPLELRLAVGAQLDPMTDAAITVRIDDARVTSAAGDQSDSFDLDCLGSPEPI
jgi:hypothetical protein